MFYLRRADSAEVANKLRKLAILNCVALLSFPVQEVIGSDLKVQLRSSFAKFVNEL